MKFIRKYEAWGHQWYAQFRLDTGGIQEVLLANEKEDIDAVQKKLEDALSKPQPIPFDPMANMIDKSVLDNYKADLKTKADAIISEKNATVKTSLINALLSNLRTTDPITKEEFESNYALRSGVTVEWLYKQGMHGEPCDCEEEGCKGWAMIRDESVVIVDGR